MVSTITAPTAHPETADQAPGTTEVPQRYRSVILVPAHNEEESIAEAVHSLLRQTVPLDHIIVACDNCTDRTVEIVREIAAVNPRVEVFETVDNRYRKSGALNAAWRRLDLDEVDFIASMDADTRAGLRLPGAGPRRHGGPAQPRRGVRPALPPSRSARTWWGRMLWRMQRAEYSRYAAVLRRRRWQVHVLSGAGALYRRRAAGGRPHPGRRALVGDVAHRGLPAHAGPAGQRLGRLHGPHHARLHRRAHDLPGAVGPAPALGLGDDGRPPRYGWKPFTRRAILCHGIAAISILIRLVFCLRDRHDDVRPRRLPPPPGSGCCRRSSPPRNGPCPSRTWRVGRGATPCKRGWCSPRSPSRCSGRPTLVRARLRHVLRPEPHVVTT